MDYPPRVSRRQLIAGAGLGSLTALAGCSSSGGRLPGRSAYDRIRRREIPSVPPAVEVADARLRELADEIADYASDGLETWDRMDEPERRVRYDRRQLENAAEFADSLPSESATAETVRSARAHFQQAVGGFAYARVRIDEFDREPTAGLEEWLAESESRHDEFAYETDDPESFLAYGWLIERNFRQATYSLSRQADADVDDRNDTTSRAERIAEIYTSVQQSRMRVQSASAYREALRERDAGGEPFDETIEARRSALSERIDDLFEDRDVWEDRLHDLEGERRDVHDALHSRSHDRSSGAENAADDGYEVYGTVELATGWLRLEAARAERDRLEAADEDILESGPVDAAKRDAVDRLEDVLESDPDPLTLLFAEEARQWISSGDSYIERNRIDDDEDRRWSLANGYASYLLAKGTLERIDEIVDLLATGADSIRSSPP